jgi:hypothetical protein
MDFEGQVEDPADAARGWRRLEQEDDKDHNRLVGGPGPNPLRDTYMLQHFGAFGAFLVACPSARNGFNTNTGTTTTGIRLWWLC